MQSTTYHQVDVSIEKRPRYPRGRPKDNVLRVPVAIDYVFRTESVEKRKEIDKRRQLAGCFVLLSNLPEDGYNAEQILRTYKEQHAIEKNFGFLKDDQIVNARQERGHGKNGVRSFLLPLLHTSTGSSLRGIRRPDDTQGSEGQGPARRPAVQGAAASGAAGSLRPG